MARVLLIVPRSPFLDSDRVFPPLGALYLQAALERVCVYCQVEDDFDPARLGEYRNFDYFGISCVTPQREESKSILYSLKRNFPSKKVILGGPHATFYTEECLGLPYDHIVVGEGEKPLADIVLGRRQDRIIRGLLSKEEMNLMPLPSRKVDFLARYQYLLDAQPATTLMTSRGCPFNCAFCEHARSGAKYYTAERIGQEIKQVVDLGYRAVMFFDDLFAVSQKRVEALCLAIKPFGIIFRCFGHAGFMTDQMAQTLAEAGCVETGVGLESGSQKILDLVKSPPTTVEQGREYIKICHRHGIKIKGFFMLGLPGETAETISQTEELIATSGIDDFDLAIYYPYQGTAIADHIGEYDLCLEERSGLGFYKGRGGRAEALVATSALSAEEIRQERDRIFRMHKTRLRTGGEKS